MNDAARPLVLVTALAAAACGPGPATSSESASSSTGEASTGAASGTEPTTGGPIDCACDDPVVHEGDLDLGGLGAYQGACLTEVTGILTLSGVDDPALLGPLARLRRVDWLRVEDNPVLTDLAPLACVREAYRLSLVDNPALVDISALDPLTRAEYVTIQNAAITALPAFAPDYQGLRQLTLSDLPALVDLDPVAAWPGLVDPSMWDGDFQVMIARAPKLASIVGLAGPLADAPGDPSSEFFNVHVELDELPALTSLAGLEPLAAGDLSVTHLAGLGDLEALAGLKRAGRLVLAGLPALGSLHGLHNLSRAGFLQLGACDKGEGLPITSLAGLDVLVSASTFALVGAPGLADLGGAPALGDVDELSLIDDPALPQAAVDDFLAQVNPGVHCVGDQVACGCLGAIPEPVHTGCPAQWSGGSAVTVSGGAPFDGVTAFFGWRSGGDHLLALVVLDASSDIEAAKATGLMDFGGTPKLLIETWRDYAFWFGEGEESVRVIDASETVTDAYVDLTITERLGDWSMSDPNDPPRLVGTLAPATPNEPALVAGPFEAVFCDAFTEYLSD